MDSPRPRPAAGASCRSAVAVSPRLATVLVALATVLLTAAAGAEPPREGLSDAQRLARGAVVARIEVADAATATRLAEGLDVWSWRVESGYLLALVTSEQFERLAARGFAVSVDGEQSDTLWRPVTALPGQATGIPGFPCYRTVEETYADLSRLAAEHPGLASWTDVGDSWEKLHGPGPGYDLYALRLTNEASPHAKSVLLVDASIHAREYATAELVSRFAERLVAGYGVDADVTWILDHTEVHVIPYLNPDGRKRAEAGVLWRKNVDDRFCTGQPLRGVDLNRNGTYFFGGSGSSGDQCSQVFRGPAPASEPETEALLDYMRQVFADQRGPGLADPAPDSTSGMYVTVHSFGEVIFLPGWGTGTAPNAEQITTLGRKLGAVNGYGTCPAGPDSASGLTHQMAYGELGVGSVLFEIGTTFFEGCGYFESQIVERNLAALLYAAKAARRPFEEPSGPDVRDVRLSAARLSAGQPLSVTATVDDTGFVFAGCGQEETQNVSLGFATVDLPRWQVQVARALRPTAGGKTATVSGTVGTAGLAPGRHTLFVYGRDAGGDVGVGTAVFFEVVAPAGGPAARPPGGPATPGERPLLPRREGRSLGPGR